MTWLDRQISIIESHAGSIVINYDHDEASMVFGGIRDGYKNVVWLEITDKEKDDNVALGNILSDAVKRALGAKLFDYGLPYAYGLKVLENQLELLGPFYFLISRADNNLQFSQDVLKLNKNGSKVLLSFYDKKNIAELKNIPVNTVIAEQEAKLKKQEAKAMAADLRDEEFIKIWENSQGKYLVFSDALNEYLGLASPKIPSPNSDRLLDKNAYEVDPNLLLDILIKQEKWLDVLEIAAPLLPQRVPEIIAKAGYHFNELGQTKRLWELLSELPKEIKSQEDVLFWLLSSAFWQGKAEELREPVEVFLNTEPAPELRALYAGVLAKPKHQLAVAREAFAAKRTSNTAYILGNYEVDIEKRLLLLFEALEIAEATRKGYDIVRNSLGLIRNLLLAGRHSEAFYWSRWAMTKSTAYKQQNSVLHLWLVAHWAYLKILFGENESVINTLKYEAQNLENAAPYQAYVFVEKLGDYMLSKGEALKALSYYERNWKSGSRQFLGRTAFNMVKVYIWLNRHNEAFSVISQARALIGNKRSIQSNYLDLAFAMVMVTKVLDKGIEQLLSLSRDKAFSSWKTELKIHHAFYLAWAYLTAGDEEKAKSVVSALDIDKNIVDSGLLIFAGPESRFKKVWALIKPQSPILELKFISSEVKIWLNNNEVRLSPHEKEIVLILATTKKGMTIETLGNLLSPDAGNLKSLKTAISKLRKKIPITKNTYRIAVDFKADFLEIYSLLEKGDLGRALSMYQQPLLLESSAPQITKMREVLAESIRLAVLDSTNFDAILELAERTLDDLALWERLLEIAPQNSTKLPYIKAMIKRIKREWKL